MSFVLAIDQAAAMTIAAHRSEPLTRALETITALGDARYITIVALALAVVLYRHRRLDFAAGLAVSLIGSFTAAYLLKDIVARPRPLHPLIEAAGSSFPSLHAACAMGLYGFLAYVVIHRLHPQHHRAPAFFVAAALVLLIGFSRVYLGVHFATDVLGGYAIGLLFLYLGVRVQRQLEQTILRRGPRTR